MSNSISKYLVSVPDISVLVARDESTVYRWIKKGKISCYEINGVCYVDGYETLRYESTIKTGRPRHAVVE